MHEAVPCSACWLRPRAFFRPLGDAEARFIEQLIGNFGKFSGKGPGPGGGAAGGGAGSPQGGGPGGYP